MPKYVFCLNAGLVSAGKGGGGGDSHMSGATTLQWKQACTCGAGLRWEARGLLSPGSRSPTGFCCPPPNRGETVVRLATTALLSVTTSATPAGLLGRQPARHGYPPLNNQAGRGDVKIATATGEQQQQDRGLFLLTLVLRLHLEASWL